MSKFDSLIETLSDSVYTAEAHTVKAPCEIFIEGKYLSINSADSDLKVVFDIDESSATSIRNLTGFQTYERDEEGKIIKINRDYVHNHKWVKQQIRYKNLQYFVDLFNNYMNPDKEYVFVMVGNKLVGVYKNYQLVKNLDIVLTIKDMGLHDYVSYFHVGKSDMYIDLHIQKINDNSSHYLRIFNNYDSSRGLGYKSVFKFGVNEFDYKQNFNTGRHLANVDAISDEIIGIISQLRDIKYHNTIQTTYAYDLHQMLITIVTEMKNPSDKCIEVMNSLSNTYKYHNLKMADEYFLSLSSLGLQHGYKMVVNNLVTKLLERLLGK